MIKHKDSHLDHGLTDAQVAHIFERFADRDGFFIETITLPEELGTVPCGLYGPKMGDASTQECSRAPTIYRVRGPGVSPYACVWQDKRGTRTWQSNLISLPPRPTREVTVIAGPHDGESCVLFTAFGGPLTPQEPGDPGCKDVEASAKFWSEHALSAEADATTRQNGGKP